MHFRKLDNSHLRLFILTHQGGALKSHTNFQVFGSALFIIDLTVSISPSYVTWNLIMVQNDKSEFIRENRARFTSQFESLDFTRPIYDRLRSLKMSTIFWYDPLILLISSM